MTNNSFQIGKEQYEMSVEGMKGCFRVNVSNNMVIHVPPRSETVINCEVVIPTGKTAQIG